MLKSATPNHHHQTLSEDTAPTLYTGKFIYATNFFNSKFYVVFLIIMFFIRTIILQYQWDIFLKFIERVILCYCSQNLKNRV